MRMQVTIGAALMAATLVGCGDSKESLVQVRTEKEANEILVALSGFDLSKKQEKSGRDVTWQLSVPHRDFDRAVAALVAKNLPRNEYGGFQRMIDSSGLIPTKTDERAKLLFARAQELEKTLELMDGVLNARVHIAVPEKDRYMASVAATTAPKEETEEDSEEVAAAASPAADVASASVMLRMFVDQQLDDDQVKELVANAVEGLSPDQVSVMVVEAELEAPQVDRSSDGPPTPPMADEERAQLEGEMRELRKNLMYAVASAVALALLLLFSLIKHLQRR